MISWKNTVTRWSREPNSVFFLGAMVQCLLIQFLGWLDKVKLSWIIRIHHTLNAWYLVGAKTDTYSLSSLYMYKGKRMNFLWGGMGGCFPHPLLLKVFLRILYNRANKRPDLCILQRKFRSIGMFGTVHTYLQNELSGEIYWGLSQDESIYLSRR